MNWYYVLYIVLTLLGAILVSFICLALMRVARTLDSLNGLIIEVRTEIIPLLGELRTTLDQVNNELDTVDEIVQSVQDAGDRVTATATFLQKIISSPIIKVASFSAGAKEVINTWKKQKGKQNNT